LIGPHRLASAEQPTRFASANGTEELEKLGNDELVWFHRAVWALAGFHFADPAVSNYFALFDWYKPVSERDWRRLLADRQ
jgi:hypothetical protein